MGRLLIIDVLVAAGLIGLWYACLVRYNRRKGIRALRWVEAACGGKGEVLDPTWAGVSTMQARLRLAGHWFENARITLRLLPRPVPIQWLLSLWRGQQETLTFEADLDCVPTLQLEIFRHRWLTQRPKRTSRLRKAGNWTLTRPGPVVLTTRTEWNNELTPVVNTLMTSRGHNLISVRFRPTSPHIAATVPLEALADKQTAVGFLNILKELAAGASASPQ